MLIDRSRACPPAKGYVSLVNAFTQIEPHQNYQDERLHTAERIQEQVTGWGKCGGNWMDSTTGLWA